MYEADQTTSPSLFMNWMLSVPIPRSPIVIRGLPDASTISILRARTVSIVAASFVDDAACIAGTGATGSVIDVTIGVVQDDMAAARMSVTSDEFGFMPRG